MALEYFSRKFHCSQSVLAAYAEELGLTEEQALKLGGCMGTGLRKGEVCGVCSAITSPALSLWNDRHAIFSGWTVKTSCPPFEYCPFLSYLLFPSHNTQLSVPAS